MPNQVPNTRLFGVEWVNIYSNVSFSPARSNLTYCEQNAMKFYTKLSGFGKFHYGNNLAWDKDFEQDLTSTSAANPAGFDNFVAETADMVYFSGHGTQDSMLFGVLGNDNGEAAYDELQLGQKGILKWLVVDACRFLESIGAPVRLGPRFQGLRYMLGFNGDCRNTADRGMAFATQLNGTPASNAVAAIPGEKIWYAWYLACVQTEGATNPGFACLRTGDANSVVHNDRWTDDNLQIDTGNISNTNFTYFKEVFLPG